MDKILILLMVGVVKSFFSTPTNDDILSFKKCNQIEKDIIFLYSENLLDGEDNRIKKGWAKRNGVYVYNIHIANHSNEPIHGSQIILLSEGKKLELINNKLAAKKIRNKNIPKALYVIPVTAVVVLAYVGIKSLINQDNDHDNDGFSDEPIKVKRSKEKRMNNLQKQLSAFKLGEQVIFQGENISGVIAVKSDYPPQKLDIQIREADFTVKK